MLFPKEPGDPRAALVPESAKKLCALDGVEVHVESGLSDHWSDADFEAAGAAVKSSGEALLASADVILRIHPTPAGEVKKLKKGVLHVSLLDPYNNRELVEAYASAGVDAISLEMIPRTTLAQKMDVLSSQASLAGYAAVIIAAERLEKLFPMMMTPAGTISPAKVFVIGAGVAGLQAIATARRLGARVEAFDTRPVVEEQVQSLGAKFLKVDLGETGQTKDGYARALTDEQLTLQREAMAKAVAEADVTITTAKLFGRKAPVIITADMLKAVRPGSVIVDLAAGSGGNVEGVVPDKEVEVDGVRLVGIDNMPGEVSINASQMLAANMVNLITHLRNDETGEILLGGPVGSGPGGIGASCSDGESTPDGEDWEAKATEARGIDEIAEGCVIVRCGEIVHQGIRKHYEGDQ